MLDSTLQQSVSAELIIVDSGSRDGSVEIARSRGVHVHEIPPQSFTFGRALNIGFALTTAPLIVSLSAHALPADGRWLERLIAPFEDPDVVATYGRQLPHADVDPFRRRQILDYWGSEPRVDAAGGVRLSNANGAVRRKAWEGQHWDETLSASEDRLWGEGQVKLGRRIVYVPEAAVYHSHTEGARAVYRRRRAEALHSGIEPKSRSAALRWYAEAIKGDLLLIKRNPREWRWAVWSPIFRASEILGERASVRRR